jgi:hypothetical protein
MSPYLLTCYCRQQVKVQFTLLSLRQRVKGCVLLRSVQLNRRDVRVSL